MRDSKNFDRIFKFLVDTSCGLSYLQNLAKLPFACWYWLDANFPKWYDISWVLGVLQELTYSGSKYFEANRQCSWNSPVEVTFNIRLIAYALATLPMMDCVPVRLMTRLVSYNSWRGPVTDSYRIDNVLGFKFLFYRSVIKSPLNT